MKGPPGSLSMDAVPSRTKRSLPVTGLLVPGLFPANAPRTSVDCVPGLVMVPGRANPVSGRPLELTGLTPCDAPPDLAPVSGLASDVPGRGSLAMALSSRSTSATPSSSISVSSR